MSACTDLCHRLGVPLLHFSSSRPMIESRTSGSSADYAARLGASPVALQFLAAGDGVVELAHTQKVSL